MITPARSSWPRLSNPSAAPSTPLAWPPPPTPLRTCGANGGFTGEWTDATGLVHLRARYYQPEVGRFFQEDPWEGSPSQPASLNPYLYAYNNPLRYADPTGQNPLLIALGFGMLGGGINYVGQVVNNVQSGLTGTEAFFHCVDWGSVGISAASMAVTALVAVLLAPFAPAVTTFWGAFKVGGVIGSASFTAGQLTSNLLTPGVPWYHQVPQAAAMGGITGGLGHGFHTVLHKAATSYASAFGRGFLGGSLSLGTGQTVYNLLTPDRAWHEGVLVASLLGGFIVGTVEAVSYGIAQANLTRGFQPIGKRVVADGRQVQGRFPRGAGKNEILYRADNSGRITNYQVYDGDGLPLMRVDLVGRPHAGVPTPHVVYFERHPAPGGIFIKEGDQAFLATSDMLP